MVIIITFSMSQKPTKYALSQCESLPDRMRQELLLAVLQDETQTLKEVM